MSNEAPTDEMLRDVLGALADEVAVSPDAYHHMRAEWVRRQRRRKRLGVMLAILVVALADLAGLWALNRADTGGAIIFEDQAPVGQHPAPVPRVGQP